MVYVFIFNMICRSHKNKAVLQNYEKVENMFGTYKKQFYHESFKKNTELIHGMTNAG